MVCESSEELSALRARWRAEGRRVVLTNGCYDVLHPGHVRLLEQARAMGDALVVALNTDASVARMKGPTRPTVKQADRAALVAAFEAVDAVAFFDEDTPEALIAALRPDVLVKGADWSHFVAGRELVEADGGIVATIPVEAGYSSSNILAEAARRA